MDLQRDVRRTSSPLATAKHETSRIRRRRGRRGRLSKSPIPKTEGSPINANQDVDMVYANDEVSLIDERLIAEMESEKEMFPGSSKWAKDEERLFEMLFLREKLPLLPCHWEVDFRLFPMSGGIFSSKEGPGPIIYAHTKEFRATMALTRLIDLTANVRTACESSLRHKAPALIKKTLEKYMRWAAEDGGFSHLKIIPNIVVEIVDPAAGEADIASTIESRMRVLARRQREYLMVDPEVVEEPSVRASDRKRRRSSWREFGSFLMERLFKLMERSSRIGWESQRHDDMVAVKPEDDDEPVGTDKARVKREREEEEDTLTLAQLPSAPRPPSLSPPAYRRTPPVVYGLFIVTTSIFLMTVDSAKVDETSHVSFHVEVDFRNSEQSLWNALTTAMVVCVARDEMMTRLEDFEEITVVEESDPDA